MIDGYAPTHDTSDDHYLLTDIGEDPYPLLRNESQHVAQFTLHYTEHPLVIPGFHVVLPSCGPGSLVVLGYI